jgi:hypothetical protein
LNPERSAQEGSVIVKSSPNFFIRSRHLRGQTPSTVKPQPAEDFSSKGEPTLIIRTTSSFDWIYDDRGSGAEMDVSIFRPKSTEEGFYIVGDFAQSSYQDPLNSSVVVKQLNVESDDPFPLLTAPIDYRLVWNDKGSGGKHDGSIWFPVPPQGYVSLGWVAQSGYAKPSIESYRCVRMDLCRLSTIGAKLWSDKGSGADKDVTVYQIADNAAGIFYAQPNYNQPDGVVYTLAGIQGALIA